MIERMNASHVPAVAEIEKLCFNDPWSENAIAGELQNNLSLWLVAIEHGVVAGYVGSQTVLGWTDMMNIAVHPDFRRKGIGEALVTELIHQLMEAGNECLTLEVRVSNTPAQSMYTKLGFVEVGRRPRYYHNPREDALILRREL